MRASTCCLPLHAGGGELPAITVLEDHPGLLRGKAGRSHPQLRPHALGIRLALRDVCGRQGISTVVVAFLCAPARRPGHGVRRPSLPELAELLLRLHPDGVPEQVGRLARLMVLHPDIEEPPPQASGAGDAIV